MKTQKFNVQKTAEARVGNSMCWMYAFGTFLEFWHRDHPEWVIQVPGDWEGKFVGFVTDGPDSRFVGELKPPRNPARRVFWEAERYLPRENYHFNVAENELRSLEREYRETKYEDEESIQKRVPGSCWYNYKVVALEKDGRLQAVTLLHRTWWEQWWRLGHIYFGKGANLTECSKMILDAVRPR